MCYEIKLFKAYFQYVKSKSLRNILELNRSKKKGKLEYSCPLSVPLMFSLKKKKPKILENPFTADVDTERIL